MRRAIVIASATVFAALPLAAGAQTARPATAGEWLPDLDQETPHQLIVTAAGSGSERVYRLGFGSAVRNVGRGPLIIDGHRPNTRTPSMTADQVIERGGRAHRIVRDVGRLMYTVSPDHRHWHYLQFDRYELRRAGSRRALVRDRKSGFCLGDRYRVTDRLVPNAAAEKVYRGRCGLSDLDLLRLREGISVGYGDDYHPFLEGQDLALSGLTDGRYVLVHRVNKDRRLRELSYANNAASVLFDLRWQEGVPRVNVLRACPDSARCELRLEPEPIRIRAGTAAAAPFVPDDKGLGEPGGWADLQWNFVGSFGVNAPTAWANLIEAGRPGGTGVTVAVLDTGVAYADQAPYRQSPDLRGTRFVQGYDFVDDDSYPLDANGHGTHVASTIAEHTNNRYGLTGLAYGVRIMPVRVLDALGNGYPDHIASGIRYAANHGAQVVNLSFNFDPKIDASQIPQVISAIDYARRRGTLVVAAAGNESRPAVAFPARARHVLAVGATTENGCLGSYSNVGSAIDLVAPGGGSDADLRDDLNCRGGRLGRPIYQMTFRSGRVTDFGVTENYVGTSMATAHVSATAALVIASGVIGPRPTLDAIQRRLKRTARDLGRPGYDRFYGWGLVDAARATTRGQVLPNSSGG